jgi:high affinity Mn2+ porin
VVGYVSPAWSLKYGRYRMPTRANGQELITSLERSHGDNLELTLSPSAVSTIVRLLAFRNVARMGIYSQALARAAQALARPDIVADDADGRVKYGFGLNVEQPLADDGATGLFARLGWNDGQTESFAFTEVDRLASFGGELSGSHWHRSDDVVGAAFAVEGLSAWHREYLAAGGYGFLLGDGRLDYAHEEIVEAYYRAALPIRWLRLQISPDYQFIRNPGFNAARGPVSFFGIRLHAEH